MKIMIITASPNIDGLTEACGKAAKKGAEAKGAEVVSVRLNDLNIGKCHACGNAWGTCRSSHTCQVHDDFQPLHSSIASIDGFVVVTPVYWGEMSESAKAFFDRLRRCEATKPENSFIEDKPVISVAAAGGSGGGVISCLSSMERLFNHMRAINFDLITITRKSRHYKLKAIEAAAEEMVDRLAG